jgi:hypothetical protein
LRLRDRDRGACSRSPKVLCCKSKQPRLNMNALVDSLMPSFRSPATRQPRIGEVRLSRRTQWLPPHPPEPLIRSHGFGGCSSDSR